MDQDPLSYLETEVTVGMDVWIHAGSTAGDLTKAQVVMIVEVPGFGTNYIVSFFNTVDWQLELRDWFSISFAEDKPINLFRR